MKILHVVISMVPGEFRGGTSTIAYRLAQAQAKLGPTVTVFTTDRNARRKVDRPLLEPVKSEGITVCHFPTRRFPAYSSPRMRTAILAAADNGAVVHSHCVFLPLNRYVDEVQRTRGAPCFYHTHGSLDPVVLRWERRKWLKKYLYIKLVEKPLLERAARVFVNTEHETRQLRASGIRARTVILPNGALVADGKRKADGGRFRAALALPADASIVLYLGRLHPKKRIDLLIHAFRRVRDSYPRCVLVIAGDREQFRSYAERCDTAVKDLGLEQAVYWPGFLAEEKKWDALAAADLFSHVSASEGMAVAILEAMAIGLPTLVGAGCYMSDAVNDNAVIEVSYTVDSLASTIVRLLSDPTMRREYSARAAARAAEHHDWTEIANETIRVYEEGES